MRLTIRCLRRRCPLKGPPVLVPRPRALVPRPRGLVLRPRVRGWPLLVRLRGLRRRRDLGHRLPVRAAAARRDGPMRCLGVARGRSRTRSTRSTTRTQTSTRSVEWPFSSANSVPRSSARSTTRNSLTTCNPPRSPAAGGLTVRGWWRRVRGGGSVWWRRVRGGGSVRVWWRRVQGSVRVGWRRCGGLLGSSSAVSLDGGRPATASGRSLACRTRRVGGGGSVREPPARLADGESP